jgi:hypothetical protein
MRQYVSHLDCRATAEVIQWAVRWYLMFPISCRDLELMLLDRGVEVDHTTIFRWIQAYAVELEKRILPHGDDVLLHSMRGLAIILGFFGLSVAVATCKLAVIAACIDDSNSLSGGGPHARPDRRIARRASPSKLSLL